MNAFVVFCVHPEGPFAIDIDAAPRFRAAFLDYTGSGFVPDCTLTSTSRWSTVTHGKGRGIAHVAQHAPQDFDYIAVLDDDVSLRISDINRLLFLGRLHQLDIFQPSLSHESPTSFPHLRNRPGFSVVATNFVEVMAPFFSRRAFEMSRDLFDQSISGWGMDIVWSDRMIKKGGKLGVIHEVVASHLRPHNSQHWTLPNGETPKAEMIRLMKANGLDHYEVR